MLRMGDHQAANFQYLRWSWPKDYDEEKPAIHGTPLQPPSEPQPPFPKKESGKTIKHHQTSNYSSQDGPRFTLLCSLGSSKDCEGHGACYLPQQLQRMDDNAKLFRVASTIEAKPTIPWAHAGNIGFGLQRWHPNVLRELGVSCLGMVGNSPTHAEGQKAGVCNV